MTPLTLRRLRAIEGALSALLAGEVGDGDWPEEVTRKDAEMAFSWCLDQIGRKEASAGRNKREADAKKRRIAALADTKPMVRAATKSEKMRDAALTVLVADHTIAMPEKHG